MDSQRFAEIYKGLTLKEEALFGIKKSQYAMDDERLYSFIEAAKIEGKRPSQVAFSYFTKHLISLKKAIETENYELFWEKITEAGDKDECIVQRFADARNYLLFMLCCLELESGKKINFGTQHRIGGVFPCQFPDPSNPHQDYGFPKIPNQGYRPIEIRDPMPGEEIEIICGSQYGLAPEEAD